MGVASKRLQPSPEVLYTTAALRNAIRDVLEQPQPGDRRVALVAYVGGRAESFLPDPIGLELVCWLEPGATNALTLGRLKKRGALLYKSEKLHMKVYWSSRKGCVVCSANASNNALGGGGLIEAGVRMPPGTVDIERLWKAARPELIRATELKKLAKETSARKPPGSHGSGVKAPSFLEWIDTEGIQSWKFGWWDETGGALSKAAKEKALKSYGVTNDPDFIPLAAGHARKDEWFLAFDVRSPMKLYWFYADEVIKVPKEDTSAYERDYPYQAIMLDRLQGYEPPPFKLDRSFKTAFGQAVGALQPNYFQRLNNLTPTNAFINRIKRALRSPEGNGS